MCVSVFVRLSARALFPTHRMCVRAVGAEGKGDGRVKDAKLPDHLLHTSDGALLVCVCKLHHQAGGGTLRQQRERERESRAREGKMMTIFNLSTFNTDTLSQRTIEALRSSSPEGLLGP